MISEYVSSFVNIQFLLGAGDSSDEASLPIIPNFGYYISAIDFRYSLDFVGSGSANPPLNFLRVTAKLVEGFECREGFNLFPQSVFVPDFSLITSVATDQPRVTPLSILLSGFVYYSNRDVQNIPSAIIL